MALKAKDVFELAFYTVAFLVPNLGLSQSGRIARSRRWSRRCPCVSSLPPARPRRPAAGPVASGGGAAPSPNCPTDAETCAPCPPVSTGRQITVSHGKLQKVAHGTHKRIHGRF